MPSSPAYSSALGRAASKIESHLPKLGPYALDAKIIVVDEQQHVVAEDQYVFEVGTDLRVLVSRKHKLFGQHRDAFGQAVCAAHGFDRVIMGHVVHGGDKAGQWIVGGVPMRAE